MSSEMRSRTGDGSAHRDPECADALERMFLFLDHEMDEADCARIRQHLADCEPCLEKYDLEGMVKSLVNRACGCDKPPEDLRTKVQSRIRQVQVELGRAQRLEG
jgi:mycothiol system anti-sigma-R factor